MTCRACCEERAGGYWTRSPRLSWDKGMGWMPMLEGGNTAPISVAEGIHDGVNV